MKLDDESGEDLVTRRDVVTTISTGIMATTVAGSGSLLEAAGSEPEANYPKALSVEECRMLDALGDTLLPGAAAAGMSRYVNYQLGRETSLLFLNYMDYPGSAIDFYKQGLKALDRQSRVRFNRPFTELNAHEKAELIRNLSQRTPADWEGPPSTLFYFVTRGDAVDVYYGTPEGFARLDVPYMAMVHPPANW